MTGVQTCALPIYHGGGPQYGGGLVGDTGQTQSEHESDGAWYFVYGAASGILGLLVTLAGLGVLVLFILRREEREYLWFSLMMLSSATSQWLVFYGYHHVWNIEVRDLVQQTVVAGIAVASIAFYQALLRPKPTLLLKLVITSVALNLLDTLVGSVSGNIQGVWFEQLVGLCQTLFSMCGSSPWS